METIDPPVVPIPTLLESKIPTNPSPPSELPAGHTFKVPPFSHGPPSSKKGRTRWPIAPDFQARSGANPVVLLDVYVWITPFLDQHSQGAAQCTSSQYRYGSIGAPLWYTRPWMPYRRRRWGFGIPSANRSTHHDSPSRTGILPYIWTYLDPSSRWACSRVCSPWNSYIHLRIASCRLSIASLRIIRPPPSQHPALRLSRRRAYLYACALSRFHFVYGDFIRWMSGEYTNRHRNWPQDFRRMTESATRPLTSDYPKPDYERAFRVCTQGVPLEGRFQTPASEIPARDIYNNHPAINANHASVEAKFVKEEAKSFHIHFPRFILHFIIGLILAPLQWAIRKGKGRICVDCSNGPDIAGSVNEYIKSPSPDNADECPPVFYQHAFARHLRRLWRTRITHPSEDILQHCDDIEAAFRRVLYHPDLAVAFAYVFGEFLIIPVGQVFGSRSAPSFFSLLSDLRASIASSHDLLSEFDIPSLAASAVIPESPPNLSDLLAPAVADELNPCLTAAESANFSNCTFVDDNGVLAISSDMRDALQQSLLSAFLLFGMPGCDRRGVCLQDDKWDPHISHLMVYLGFIINSRDMTVSWPLYKREELFYELQAILSLPSSRRQTTPRQTASILGKLRSAIQISPWGVFLSFSLATNLKRASRNAYSPSRSWWSKGKIRLNSQAINDIRLLMETLLAPEEDPIWTRPIALLVPRTATHWLKSDASYAGIGGWSLTFGTFMWRVTREDLILFGFNMKTIGPASDEPTTQDATGLHINPLEFLAVIINLWLALKIIHDGSLCPTGYIIDLLSDNTTALSWMHVAATTPNPELQQLARFASALLVQAARLLTRVQPLHLPGILNEEADTLSRRSKHGHVPSWAHVISQHSQLTTCRICLLPRALLSSLASLLSSPRTEVTFDRVTTELLTLDLSFLPAGSTKCSLLSSLQPL